MEGSQKKAAEANTEKWEKKVQDLQGKIKAKKAFLEEQNNIQKTAHAKGEKMKSADALRQTLRAAELARMTVEREHLLSEEDKEVAPKNSADGRKGLHSKTAKDSAGNSSCGSSNSGTYFTATEGED